MNETLSVERQRDELAFPRPSAINRLAAQRLREAAALLVRQGADGYRERAYRAAADTLDTLERGVDEILAERGRIGLTELPTIGRAIAAALAEMVVTGRWSQLDRLRGESDPARLFTSVPGVGATLARRFAEELHLETLADLEQAMRSPEIRVQGLGPRRRETIVAVLAERLGRPLPHPKESGTPPESLVLEVDQTYREAAAAGALALVGARAGGVASPVTELVPVLHRRIGQWSFSATYSSTLRARQAGKARDWVVVHYQADGHLEGRCTVVTGTRGEEKGRRVVRGLEHGRAEESVR